MLALIAAMALADAPVQVVVAAREIPPAAVVQPTDLVTVQMDPGLAVPDAFSGPDLVVGRVALQPILQGAAVRSSEVSAVGADPLAALLPQGMVRLHVGNGAPMPAPGPGDVVDAIDAHGGCLLAGAATVLAAHTADGALVTDPVAPARPFASLELATTPGDAKLLVAANPGTVVWAIRSIGDKSDVSGEIPRCAPPVKARGATRSSAQ
jgi:Flp pilus assembly protein CpaB